MTVTTHMKIRRTFLATFVILTVIMALSVARLGSRNAVQAEAQMPRKISMLPSSSSREIDLSMAMDERKVMLERSVHVSFVAAPGATPLSVLDLSLKDHPLWITFDVQNGEGKAVIDAERVKQYLISYPPQGIPAPQSCILLSTETDEHGVVRATTDCTAKSGYVYDQTVLAADIKEAFETGSTTVENVLTFVPAVITNPSNGSATPMKLLSTGHSTFAGSGIPRKSNVRKALNERVHNIIVPTDAVFSFNDTLGTVSVSRGWQMALTIFEGTNLRPAPGGGICQASTTTYRAALAAGFPIVEQKNHSLYVTYYEKFGVGQDATIFPGKQDLKFKNDTGSPLLIQAYNDGDEAYVQIYGSDDARSVELSGPYFGKTAPKDLLENGKILKNNEIGWVRTVTMDGAEPKREVFIARYKALPKSLSSKWELTTVMTRGEGAKSIVASKR